MSFNTFVEKLSFIVGLEETVWGKMIGMIVGSFHVFIKSHDSDLCFAGQSPCFPENLDFHFLCLNNLFLFGDSYERRLNS